MGNQHRIRTTLWICAATALLVSAASRADLANRDAKEIGAYVLTEAGLAKYTQAVKNLGPLTKQMANNCGEDDDSDEAKSLDETAARVDKIPGVHAAITSAGMTTREYLVFTFSLFQNGMAAWALGQGGNPPPGTSMANVKFYKAHEAAIKSLGVGAKSADCDNGEDEEGDDSDSQP
jgi:hypothetical protein